MSLSSVLAEVDGVALSTVSIHCNGFADLIFSLLENFRFVEGSGFASRNLTVNDASTIKSKLTPVSAAGGVVEEGGPANSENVRRG